MTRLAEQMKMTEMAVPAADWLKQLRAAGAGRFKAVGFPAKDTEEWRHTQLGPIVSTPFRAPGADLPQAASAAAGEFTFGNESAVELVFVAGRFVPGLSKLKALPRGARVMNLADAVEKHSDVVEPHLGKLADLEKNPFVALNTGNLADGAFVHLAKGALVEQPIHLLFISTPSKEPVAAHPRVLVVAEENVQATIVESYVGAGAGVDFTNAVTEIAVGRDSIIDHYKLQQAAREAYHVATMQVVLDRSARFVSHSATLGGRITRNDLNVIMNGEYADATLNGLVIVGGEQHVDNHTLLHHEKANCPSHELYKHVLDGKATGVFKGKIFVQKDAQKTDSKQSSKTLLLSEDAVMNSQPALEIYADDVKCTHGSTTGPVDEDMVFYLRTRGVSLDAARHLLTYAFAADVTRRIRVAPVRRRLENFMAAQHGLPQDLRITDLGAHDEAAL